MADDNPSTQPRRRLKRRHLPIARFFPNLITIASLCCGLSSIRWAMLEHWDMAVAFIFIATILDGMDGRIARLLKATSTFGAQLDSLSDFVCFGVAPVLVIYMWRLHMIKGVGWVLVMFFTVCCALRLARFNTHLIEPPEREPWEERFFTGVAAPAGALLALFPMVLTFQLGEGLFDSAYFLILYIPLVAWLMASTLPTLSIKRLRIRHDLALPVMLLCVLCLVILVTEPWLALSIAGLVYWISIPVCIFRASRLRDRHKSANPDESSSQ